MMMAICDNCKKARPARFVANFTYKLEDGNKTKKDKFVSGGGYVGPPLWFEHPTDDPRVVVLACSSACANTIDINRAIRKAKYLQSKNGDTKSGGN